MHRDLCVPQIIAQVLSHSLDCRLGCIVSSIAGWIGDTLLGARDHDRRRCIRLAGLEAWNEGVETVNHTEEIRIEDLEDTLISTQT
jgi:hypothetical protein